MHTKVILPKDYSRAFKPADIRGVYPEQIDEKVAYAVARGFVEEFGYKKLVVGYDMRLSTPALRKAFVQGARESGASVVDIGMVRSPMLYFASGHLKLPGAVITASHSPADYNGIKLVHTEAVPLTAETGLDAIKQRVAAGNFRDAKRRGSVTKKSVRRAYRAFILKGVDKKSLKGLKVIADIGNGMAGVSMAALDTLLPIQFPMLFKKPDGRFPNRGSDPCLRKNQKALSAEIVKKKADFGIGFDGDGDRIAFLDEKGKYVNCAVIGALIAERLIEKEPKAGIVFTNLTSKVFEETITENGGKAYRARVGHTFLKEKMRKTGAVFGAEHSGHFFWREFFNTDSTVLTLLAVLEVYAQAKQDGKSFSQMVKPYQQYHQTEDVVIHVKDKKVALAHIQEHLQKLKPQKVTKFDGFFVDFGDVWGAIKPSVTEYAIKLMFESKRKTDAVKVQKELVQFVQSIADKTK
tara:strand:- start:843 stop:2237 length:1395 start_codon:yes stop_codon:yes gene_type:complete